MKNLLILLALAGFGTAVGCGDDDGGGDDKGNNNTPDAGGTPDSSTPARPQQIDTDKLGTECTAATEATACTGPGGECVMSIGTGMNTLTFEGGYCTAMCEASSECSENGGCPVFDVINGLGASLAPVIGPFIKGIFPSYCFEKCAGVSDCRDGYSCSSIKSAVERLAPDMASLLPASQATMQTYCFPPVSLPGDGGVPAVDAGSTTVVVGMDGGV